MPEFISSLIPFLIFLFVINTFSSKAKKKNTAAGNKSTTHKVQSRPSASAAQRKPQYTAKPQQPVTKVHIPIMDEEVHEGDDPCHPDPVYHEHIHDIPRETVTNEEPIFADWKQSDIARAMIIHEVMTHPWERKRKT